MVPTSQEEKNHLLLLVPSWIALTTVVLRVLKWGRSRRYQKSAEDVPIATSEDDLTRSDNGENQDLLPLKSDGLTVFLLRLARLFCVLALLSLSVRDVSVGNANLTINAGASLVVFYIYVGLLSCISIASTSDYWRITSSRDASFCLFVAFLVYFVEDIWPYFIMYPIQTHHQDWIAWTRIALLSISGIFIPLVIPPPRNSYFTGAEMNYPLFSRITFSFMDSVIFFAYRTPDLKLDDLPPIPFSHRAAVLAKHSLPKMDPLIVGKRHLIWGLLTAFTADYAYMCLWTFLYALSKYLSPYAMRGLLTYLEASDVPSFVLSTQVGYTHVALQVVFHPWFWIVLVALAPIMSSIFFQWFVYSSTLVQVKGENLLTQLIFEHALRMRVHSDAGESGELENKSIDNIPINQSLPAESVPADASASGTTTEISENSDGTLSESLVDSTANNSTVALSETGSKSNQDVSKKPPITQNSPKTQKTTDTKKKAPLLGKLNNLLTTDITMIKFAQESLGLPSAIIQAGIGIVFLYNILGWSALVGLAVFIVSIPAPAILSKMLLGVQRKKMGSTDQRVQSVTETIQILRTLKLLAWEAPTLAQLSQKRQAELRWILRGKILDLCLNLVEMILPLLSLLATFGTYALIQKQPLNAARAFPALTVFNLLQEQIYSIMFRVPQLLRSKVSFDRFNDFLHNTEVLVQTPMSKPSSDDETDVETNLIDHPTYANDRIGFYNASFSWNETMERPGDSRSSRLSVSSNRFKLRLDNEVLFRKGKINLIVGPTASGKTSLLMALLGEMYYIPHGTTSWYNLPRDGGIAYAPQESWVINATVKENIVFNQSFDELRYRKVLKQCSLEKDLSLWEAGDMTEVGEKGLTLSGGQKARVTLARALYSNASIVLLDDPLAALDVHTAKDIANNALRGDLVRNRTIILVTHNIPLAAPLAEHVIALGNDGRIVSQGSINEALKKDDDLRALAEKEQAEMEMEAEEAEGPLSDQVQTEDKTAAGKLIVAEEKAIGHVEWTAIKLFVDGVGGPFVWTVYISLGVIAIVCYILETWAIGFWASQYENRPPSEVSSLFYLALYAAIVLGASMCMTLCSAFWVWRTIRASRVIHQKLLRSILNAPLRWLDVVPVGRIITRCTQDIDAVDGTIANYFGSFVLFTFQLLALFFSSVFMTGWPALISGAITAGMGGWLGLVYLKAQLSVKREVSNAKSPVVSQVGTAVSGIVTIRAYGAQPYFREGLSKRVDAVSRAGRTYCDLNRWIAFRIDLLGSLFAAVVASYLVYGHQLGSADVGFTLSVTLAFCRQIMSWVRLYNTLEVESNSLERILDFLRIDQEPQPVESGKPPAYWPASGNLKVENLSASYSDDGPLVLRDLTFEIKSGERVGIVGRTGAGKSSIALALLRAIKSSGKVYYDNVATDTLNLNALRLNITLIPQQPELIRGTLRENLDPFGDYDDATMNDVLRSTGLFDLGEQQPAADNSSDETTSTRQSFAVINLDTAIDSGGTNLSLGQRQIIALARAILRGSKVLILDEATAAIDYKTDTAIQKSLRTELRKDTTVITIAHRLQTIMDSDKILVLDAGQIAEFDSPVNLLRRKEGFLRGLVDASDDKDQLLTMAGVQSEDM